MSGSPHVSGHVSTHVLGIDFGGTGIKGAMVDLDTGELASERIRILTPEDSTPEACAAVFRQLVDAFPEAGSVGVTVPGVVRRGVVESAGSISQTWLGVNADEVLSEAVGHDVHAINDADAAAIAEAAYGAARGQRGLVLMTTLGTGIGSALVHDGVLIPNLELGQLQLDGRVAEHLAANSVREREELSWAEWGERLTRFYRLAERILTPDLIVVGGGISKKAEEFLHHIDLKTPVVPATLRNRAGIVGAALWGVSPRRAP